MSTFDIVRSALTGFAHRLAAGRKTEFICQDCERWQRCGLPPDANCIARAEQIERREREATPARYPLPTLMPYRPPFEVR
jgi:hypothetical protein